MSINSEIERIKNNVSDALAATSEMGASVPATASSDNLGTLIRAIPKANVVQSTGNSTSDVMSQAAVTNALNNQADFCVNMEITESPDPETILLQTDKTYEQVIDAYASGKSVYARVSMDGTSVIAPLTMAGDGQAMFLVFTGESALIFVMGDGGGNFAVQQILDMGEALGIHDHLFDVNNPHNVTAAQVGAPTVAQMNTAINNAKYTLPTASSSTLGGVKVGSNLSISSGVLSVPSASGTKAGVTIVYPAASCTTYTSDSGTCTPAAVKKAVSMFEPKAHAHSWDAVTDKPFAATGGDTLTWDGSTEGRVSVQRGTTPYILVSEVVPTESDFSRGVSALYSDGSELSLTLDWFATSAGALVDEDDTLKAFVAFADGAEANSYNVVFPQAGLYFPRREGREYITSLTISGYTGFVSEKLNASSLPDVSDLPAYWINALKVALGI